MPSTTLPSTDSRELRLTRLLGQIIHDLPMNRDWLNPDVEKEARELIAYLPSAVELSACLDARASVKLTELHELVIDGLMKLKSSGASPNSFERFRHHIVEFVMLSGHFTLREAVDWYVQPVTEWNLIENSDRSKF